MIALSVHDEDSVRRAALQAGADEFVVKRAIATDLFRPSSAFAPRRRRSATGEGSS